MKDIVKEFNMIDLLGMIFPGSVLMAMVCAQFELNKTVAAILGVGAEAKTVSGVLITMIVLGGYGVGMLLHEIGDVLENFMHLRKGLDPKYYIALHFFDTDHQLCDLYKVNCLSMLGVPGCVCILAFALICPPLLIDFVAPKLEPWVSALFAVGVMFALGYVVVFLSMRLEKKMDANTPAELIGKVNDREKTVNEILTWYSTAPDVGKTETASRSKLFEGFSYMARNTLIMAFLIHLFAKFTPGETGIFFELHHAVVTDWRLALLCGAVLYIFALRYWHYSFLKLKYIAEACPAQVLTKESEKESAKKPTKEPTK